jgi:hypothetical protein
MTGRAEESTAHTRRDTQPQCPGLHGSRMLFIERKIKVLTNDFACTIVFASCIFPQVQVAYRVRRDRPFADVGAEGNQIQRCSPNFYKLSTPSCIFGRRCCRLVRRSEVCWSSRAEPTLALAPCTHGTTPTSLYMLYGFERVTFLNNQCTW